VPDQNTQSRPRRKQRGYKGPEPLLVVLSGPSGVGKDAVLGRMKELRRPFHYVVTATTRPKRPSEKDGVDYHFLSREQFQQMVDNQQFLEWANVYGNYYGVPKEEIRIALSRRLDAIVRVDVQGAATIKRIVPQAVLVFLAPPSMKELENRLKKRQSERSEDFALRLKKAKEEIKSLSLFDYLVVNHQDKLDEVVSKIDAIVSAEKCRVGRRTTKL